MAERARPIPALRVSETDSHKVAAEKASVRQSSGARGISPRSEFFLIFPCARTIFPFVVPTQARTRRNYYAEGTLGEIRRRRGSRLFLVAPCSFPIRRELRRGAARLIQEKVAVARGGILFATSKRLAGDVATGNTKLC